MFSKTQKAILTLTVAIVAITAFGIAFELGTTRIITPVETEVHPVELPREHGCVLPIDPVAALDHTDCDVEASILKPVDEIMYPCCTEYWHGDAVEIESDFVPVFVLSLDAM